jgi:hypothetical protein
MCGKINKAISAENVCNLHTISKEPALSSKTKLVRPQIVVNELI